MSAVSEAPVANEDVAAVGAHEDVAEAGAHEDVAAVDAHEDVAEAGAHEDVAAAGAGDVGELFTLHAKRLAQIVRVDVRAPEPVIEDACQFAWTRLIFHAHRIRRETALAWLVTTAVHHAFKDVRRDARQLSFEALLEAGDPLPGAPAPEDVLAQRLRLADLGRLPERQQRLLWLQGAGLSYREIAAREGCTRRTVERQLLRAKRSMRELDGR